MNKKDDFDRFLKVRFQKTKTEIKDDGFTDRVISGLPNIRDYSLKRYLVLFLFGMLSVIIFFISNGFKSLIISITELLDKSLHLTMPSLISFIAIISFIWIIAVIASYEYSRNSI